MDWYTGLGIRPDHLKLRPHDADELSHYSSATSDVEYLYPIGWSELEGIANRGDFDLKQHAEYSGEKLEYFDQQSGERYVPHVIEPAAGVGPLRARVPVRRLRRGRHRRRHAHGAQAPPHARAGQGRGAPAAAQGGPPGARARDPRDAQARRASRASTTRAARSASATAARTRSARPTASPSTTRRSRTTPSPLRDRDTLTQERIAISALPDELHARLSAPWQLAEAGLTRTGPGTFRSTWARTSPRRSSVARIGSVTARRCARASTCSRACSRRRASTRSGARWGSRSSST